MFAKALLVTPIYVLVGMLLFAQTNLAQKAALNNVSAAQSNIESSRLVEQASKKAKKLSGVPVNLYIPRLNLRLPVTLGAYNALNKTWTLSNNSAHFALQTQENNNKSGLTLIYGHNNKAVFGKTAGIADRDIVEITTKNNLVFSYSYIGDTIVAPTDTSILSYSGKPRLSILSCTGAWNENRRIMNFDLQGVRTK